AVIDRNDILRTAFVADGLAAPVQVVLRRAALGVEELAFDGDVEAQLRSRFDPAHHRLDVRRAPLWNLFVAEDVRNGRWLALEPVHHLIADDTSARFMIAELEAHLLGEGATLPPPVPFRDFVMQARLGVDAGEHEAFFGRMLSDVGEPTMPFGLVDV